MLLTTEREGDGQRERAGEEKGGRKGREKEEGGRGIRWQRRKKKGRKTNSNTQ